MNKYLITSITALTLSSASMICAAHDESVVQAPQADPWRNTVWSGFNDFFAPDWKQDFSATVGVKLWMNEWRRDQFVLDTAFGAANANGTAPVAVSLNGAPRGQTSDTEVTPIPQISLRYKWLILSGSYYAETDFDFPTTSRLTSLGTVSGAGAGNPTLSTFDESLSASRYEWDLAGGIYVHPNIALLGGYKEMHQSLNYSSRFNASLSNGGDATSDAFNQALSYDTTGQFDVSGPTIGIAASVPMGSGFGVYGSYAHGFLTLDDGASDLFSNPQFEAQVGVLRDRLRGEKDVSYDVAELGITYTYGMQNLPAHLPLSAATAYFGYRYQAFETDLIGLDRNFADRSDKTQGFVAGVNLAF